MLNRDMPAMPQNGEYNGCDLPGTSDDFGGMGLTKREHFAAMAMQGFAANPKLLELMGPLAEKVNKTSQMTMATLSLEHADALLAALVADN
jgi:hypothetical protein